MRGIACDAHMPSAYLHPPGGRAPTDRAGLHCHLRLCADKPRCGTAARQTCARQRPRHGAAWLACPTPSWRDRPACGMPAAAQRPRSGGGAWAARLTEGSWRPLSCLVEPPRALADWDAPFSCRLRPRSPKCRRAQVQNIDVSFHFNILASRAQMKLKAKFEVFSTEVSLDTRTHL